jgi:hypothetical protein
MITDKYNFFNGHWVLNIPFDKLSKVFSFNGYGREIKFKDKIQVRFFEKVDLNPDPSQEQLDALNYIFENQEEIIESIYNSIVNIIFPLHKTFIEDEEMFFPKVNSSSDIKNVLGIEEVILHNESKNGISYSTFVFNHFSADPEHGQTITMHKSIYISSGEDWDWRPICKDLGIEYEIIDKQNSAEYLKMRTDYFFYHEPNQKYGTLKEWQKSANQSYAIRLIQNNMNAEFINLYHDKFKKDPVIQKSNLEYWANESGNIELINFLKNESN